MATKKKAEPGGPAAPKIANATSGDVAGKSVPAPTGNEAEVLRAWWLEHTGAPTDWRACAKLLAEGSDMPAAWVELRKNGDIAMDVFSDVCQAFREANLEVRRESAAIERRKLQRVTDLALGLKEAIEMSPLPKDVTSRSLGLKSRGRQPIDLRIGWRDLVTVHAHELMGYPLAVVDLLDTVVDMVDVFEKSLPARAVFRHRGDPLMSAFVRYLVWLFMDRFGSQYQGTVAVIANTIVQPSEPMTKQAIQAILKDSPAPFRTKLKQSNSAA